jgi:peptidyl-tRNA hydrolase
MTKIDEPRDDIPEVVIVVNGALKMGEGKSVGQAFQLAARAFAHRKLAFHEGDWLLNKDIQRWFEIGTRTVVKRAKTQAIFDRVVREVPGYVMVDEGFTEVEPGSATMFVSWPFLHKDRPQVLDNKKVPLL